MCLDAWKDPDTPFTRHPHLEPTSVGPALIAKRAPPTAPRPPRPAHRDPPTPTHSVCTFDSRARAFPAVALTPSLRSTRRRMSSRRSSRYVCWHIAESMHHVMPSPCYSAGETGRRGDGETGKRGDVTAMSAISMLLRNLRVVLCVQSPCWCRVS